MFFSTYPDLHILLQHSSQQSTYNRTLNAKTFPLNIQHTSAFMNLRAYGTSWYDSQKLDNLLYIVPCQLRKIIKNKLQVEVPLFSDGIFTFDYKNFYYYIYLHILVNENISNEHNWWFFHKYLNNLVNYYLLALISYVMKFLLLSI